jgi:hypothetical protein
VSGGITGEVGTVAGTEDGTVAGTVAGTENGMAEVGTEVGAGTAAVPATVFTEAPSWATVAHPAIGVARGVTAATRRSTEGIRTDRGIRPRKTAERTGLCYAPVHDQESTTLSQTTLDESAHFILKPFSTMPDASPRPRSPTCTFSPSGSRTWKLSESFCGSNPAAASLARNTSAS